VAARHLITGKAGEELAAAFLVEKGMRVMERNFRCTSGEIDLVCADKESLVFVEVKTRSGDVRGEPGEAIGPAKKKRLVRAAALYLSRNRAWSRPCRFDLVSILFLHGETVVEHWEDIINVRDALDRGHAPWQPW
jgi:putative endonuclease